MALPRRLARILSASLLALGLLALGACSDDDGGDDASPTTAAPDDGEGNDEEGETTVPVLPDEERDFGIADDERASDISEPAIEHFGDRWAGLSFDIPESEPPVMRLHVVGATDDDRAWVRDLVASVESGWVELVEVIDAVYSLADLVRAFETVLDRANELGVQLPVQLDTAGNRVAIADDSVEPPVREQLREGLPDGIVLFLDEIPDEDDEDDE